MQRRRKMFQVGGALHTYTGVDPGLRKRGGGGAQGRVCPGAMCAQHAVARGVWGHAPPGNFKVLDVNSGAFWDIFTWQGTRTNLYLSDHIIISWPAGYEY